MVGFTLEEIRGRVKEKIDPGRVAALLDFASTRAEDIRGEPDLLALPPIAKTPLIRHGDRFYMFVPARLFESLYYAFHSRLFADETYRPTYDRIRADCLERSAVDAFRKMLSNAEAGWGLAYGPKRQRLDLDGLIRYANKLILIECKWKSPTLLALSGDVVAALKDALAVHKVGRSVSNQRLCESSDQSIDVRCCRPTHFHHQMLPIIEVNL